MTFVLFGINHDFFPSSVKLTEGLSTYALTIPVRGVLGEMIRSERSALKSASNEEDLRITIASFAVKEMMENTIIKWLQRVYGFMSSFQLSFNNYGGYPQNSIYLRVQHSEALSLMAQQLKTIDEYIRSGGCPGMNIYTRPQLPIGMQLSETAYEKAIPEYSRKIFNASFEVEEIELISYNAEKGTRVVNIFRLLPVSFLKHQNITSYAI